MIKDEYKRLGSRAGAADIKNHIADVKWALLRHAKPPIVPVVKDRLDTSNFRALDDDQGDKLEFEKEILMDGEMTDPFAGFETLSVVRN